jgi:hypothetical protein
VSGLIWDIGRVPSRNFNRLPFAPLWSPSPVVHMDNDDGEHEIENDGAKATDGHETGDETTSGSGRKSRRRSHTVMPPLL